MFASLILVARLVAKAYVVYAHARKKNGRFLPPLISGRKQNGRDGVCHFIYLTISFCCCLKAIEHPVRTNQIPRQIPEQSFYTKPLPGIIMGGILPFGCIFIQLFFILNSIW